MSNYVLTGNAIDVDLLVHLAKNSEQKICLSKVALQKMKKSNQWILKAAKGKEAIYGINTGFGALSDKKISTDELEELQLNLIRSHATGIGKPIEIVIVRMIMLLRIQCLVQGYSGANPQLAERLIQFLNFNITPVIPEKGSVGASGDLAPLAHMSLTLIGEGEVFFQNKKYKTKDVLKKFNLSPIRLGPKDGLALINGTSVMAAIGSFAVVEAKRLAKIADIVGAMTVDAMEGTDTAFRAEISRLKPHSGQIISAQNLTLLLKKSAIRKSHLNCSKVQDPYSLRCMPQVHGASRGIIRHVEEVLNIEINSVTDNPLIFTDQNEVLSGGNFHGQAISHAFDYLALSLSEFCSISERRVEKMMNPSFSSLPAFLTKNSGPNSGLMIAHVTHAAITSENKMYCTPCSIDSIPTSTDKEDHVSMGLNSAKKLREIIFNCKYGLSIELLCSTQGIDFRRPKKTSPLLEILHEKIRKLVPVIGNDRIFANDIESIHAFLEGPQMDELLQKEFKDIL